MDRAVVQGLRRAIAFLSVLELGACAVLPEHSDAPAKLVRGPIPARVQQPVKLTYLAFRPRRAVIEPPGKTRLSVLSAYSNIFENETSGNDEVDWDGEIWRTSLVARRAVSPGADVEIELPVVYASSGFLDGFIEGFHDLFGFPDGGREDEARYSYDMVAVHRGQEAYRLEGNEPGLGDVPLVVTAAIQDEGERSPALAVRAGVELPTGSESRGFGNGEIDWGLGLLAERSFGRWTATGAIDWVDTASSRSFERADVEAHDDLDLQLGVEYRWNDELSLLLGTVLSSPSTRDIPLEEIDRENLSLDIGAAWDLGPRSRLLLDFGEDLVTKSGPDFTVLAAWSVAL